MTAGRKYRTMMLKRLKLVKAWLIVTTVLSSMTVIILHGCSNLRQPQTLGQWSTVSSLSEDVTHQLDAYNGSARHHVTPILEQEIAYYAINQHPPRDSNRLTPTCVGILFRRKKLVREAERIRRFQMNNLLPSDFNNLTRNCEDFRTKQEYMMFSTPQELDFPLAYSIILYKDVAQMEKLLRAIYRPHNFYCIHVDAKANDLIHHAIKNIANCLQNVFVTPKPVDVKWGKFGVLEAELKCMRDLLEYKQWKYFINLTGQEYPLKTNLEIVKILKIFKGANNVDASWNYRKWYVRRWAKAWPPPHGIRPYKGNLHVFVNRDFVEYALNNPIAKDFIAWLKNTTFPDETFFATLNHNPHLHIPGSYTGLADTDIDKKPYIARFKNWPWPPYSWPCRGKRVRNICVFGVGDLPLLVSRHELFANKFHWKFEPLALDCLEWWHNNKVFADNNGKSFFDDTYYKKIPYINNNMIIPL